jgi:hypothetical protein
MTRLLVAFRNFANAPKSDLMITVVLDTLMRFFRLREYRGVGDAKEDTHRRYRIQPPLLK